MRISHDFHNQLLPIWKQAEALLKEAYQKEVTLEIKTGIQDTTSAVTETDRTLDQFFRDQLTPLFPDFGFITEELGSTDVQEYNWVIDPIDGTLNFSKKLPMFGLSISLWQKDKSVYGYLSLPLFAHRLHAIRGKGAYYNKKPLRFVHHQQIVKPYIFLAHVGDDAEKLELVKRITYKYAFPKTIGCAIFYAAQTLIGNSDAAIFANLAPWDIGAAIIIAQEAGAGCELVTPPFDITDPNFASYKHTLVIGQKILVKSLVSDLKSILAR